MGDEAGGGHGTVVGWGTGNGILDVAYQRQS